MPHIVRRGSGTPILFVHGNGVDHRLLLDLDDVFDADGAWERLHLDLPGFGRTPALDGDGGLPDLADWLERAARDLIGPRPFAVVANSLGGLLAGELVARAPARCRGLALLAPVVDPEPSRRTLPEPVVLDEDPSLMDSLEPEDAEAFAEVAVLRTRDAWERFRVAALPGIRAVDPEAARRLSARYRLPASPWPRLAGLDRPVIVLAGRQDAVVGSVDQEALSRTFPRSTYAVLDRAGHNVHLDQPELVRAHLAAWAREVRRSAEGLDGST